MQLKFDKMSEEIVFAESDAIDHFNIGHLQNIPPSHPDIIGKSLHKKHLKKLKAQGTSTTSLWMSHNKRVVFFPCFFLLRLQKQ